MTSIDRISYISVEDFYSNYLTKNTPCIFKKEFTQEWLCTKYWKDHLKINIENVFQFNKSTDTMNVADCNAYYFDSHLKSEMSVFEFSSYWESYHNAKDNRLLYLKDWHYFLNQSHSNEMFTLLPHFSSDWLNEFSDIRTDIIDDYRFVYIGVKGSWTGCHVDVFKSYSWSANIVGQKRWILFPVGHEPDIGGGLNDIHKIKNWQESPHIDVIQEEGEIIFVPSGWYHQVENLTDCVSINHNWLNGFNINASWSHLCQLLDDVERETDDVKNTPGYMEQCQVCLKAYSGINFVEFIGMIEFIVYKRLKRNLDSRKLVWLDIPERDRADISMMRHFFEGVFCFQVKDWKTYLSWTQKESRLDILDIQAGLRALQLIAADSRCNSLGLISIPLQQFVKNTLDFVTNIQ